MESPIQTDFIRWIVFLPLIGAIINGLLGAKIQKSMGKGAISVHRLRAGDHRVSAFASMRSSHSRIWRRKSAS